MRILVLAGGFDQIAFVQELKQRGHNVILADYYSNPPARNYADKHYQVSTLDEKEILKIAKDEKIELITTACTDQALLTMAKVSEKLNLPTYLSYQTALNVTNKLYMKEIFMNSKIPTSQYKVIQTEKEITKINMEYPLVVKPCDCNSSKGVKKVEGEKDLKQAIKEALILSRTNRAIVEEYKEGIELSIDVFVQEQEVTLLSITQTQKIKNNENTFTICKSVYKSDLINKSQEKEICSIARNIAKAFQIKNAPMLIQVILNEKEINVLEFSPRMGGGSKYKLIETISNVNIMKEYVNLILKQPIEIIPKRTRNFVELNYCYCENGVIEEIYGFEKLKSTKEIVDYFQYKTKGMKISQALNSGDRVAGYLITARTQEELEKKRQKINQTLRIYDDNNIDIYKRNYEVK